MKKIFIILALVILPQTAIAGDWVLWSNEFMPDTLTNPPLPLTEHKSLDACLVASEQEAAATFAWAKKEETIQTESVRRSMQPNGAMYKYKTGVFVQIEFRCYPYGVVPTQGAFRPKETQ